MHLRSVSAALYLALCALTIVDALADWPPAVWAASSLVVVFLVLEGARIARLQALVGLALAGSGLLIAATQGALADTLVDGLRRTLPFLLLFASVTWLQIPAAQSPALLKVRAVALAQPPGRRFAVVGTAAHFLGVAFNLAGLSLLTPMVSRETPPSLRERLGRAMVQGFGAGTAWSPFYVGTAVILSAVPGVRWIEVAPVGLGLALLLVVWSWGFDRLFLRRGAQPTQPSGRTGPPPRLTGGDARNLAVLLGVLFGATILLVEGLLLSIPVSLAIVAPLFALGWAAVIRTHDPEANAGRVLIRTVYSKMPDLRGETLLFAGANILGVGVASALTPETVAGAVDTVAGIAWLAVPLLMLGMVGGSMLGLHPVVFVVLVTSVLPPETLGLTPQIMALAMMSMWGQSTNSSPFSATSLFMARITGDSNWRIAWRWNAPFAVTATGLLALVLVLIDALGVYGA